MLTMAAMWSAVAQTGTSICGFARRHKKLVTVTGVAALCGAGAYYAYRRVQSEAERFTQQLQQQIAEHQRLQLSLASTCDESNATVQRFLPKLKKRLYQLADLEKLVTELKQLEKTQRTKRAKLWEEAKITAVTRYFTALIAFGVWHLLVFAQIAIIGKRTFERAQEGKSEQNEGEANVARQAAQHAFLVSGLEYFLDEGIDRIHQFVQKAVVANEQLQSWEVSKKLKVEKEELNELLQDIYLSIIPSRNVCEEDLDRWATWRSFLIYDEKKPNQSEAVISLLNDLWDLLESDLFAPALQQSLAYLCGNAFQDLCDHVYGDTERKIVIVKEDERDSSESPRTDDAEIPPPRQAPALAKLVPMLQAEVNKLLTLAESGNSSYSQKYSMGLGELEAFRNFYEAIYFQQDERTAMLPQFI